MGKDSEIRGRFGEKLTPRIRKFEQGGSRSGRGIYRKSTSETGHDDHTHDRPTWPDYYSGSQEASSKNAYPSLSFRHRTPGSRTAESYDSRFIGRDQAVGGGHGSQWRSTSSEALWETMAGDCRNEES